jgi:two-component system, OmpR family, sensor histidine kinase CreC
MTSLLLIAASSVALILFVAFIIARLLRSRTAGLSIRMQIFLALAGIVGTFAFGLGVLVVDRVKARATFLAEESARAEATAVATLIAREVGPKGKTLDDVARDLAGMQGLAMVILSPDGTTVLDASGHYAEGGPGSVSVTVPITADGTHVGDVRVIKPTIVIQRVLADVAPAVLVISVVLGAAAAIAAARIGKAIASPIENLTEFAERVSEGELRAKPPAPHGREVMRLTTAIDTMRRELEGRPFVEAFAADLSHELKNPVAAIRASAEVLADGALEEPEEAERFLARIREATSRIEALLGELLSLARLEARGVEGSAVVELGDVAREVARRARERGAQVELAGVMAQVKGDRAWLVRLLENLVDNAVVHGKEDAPIRVDVASRGSDVSLRVTSSGEIGEHVRRRIFRRFVTTRPDKGGTGLGLAIVRAVAEAHGGSVACVRYGPPEVCFELKLPSA